MRLCGARGRQGGWTLIELMMTVAMIGIITPAITFLFVKVNQGMAGDEMHTQMRALNEQTQLRLHEHLLSTKHLFQNDASVSFLGPVTLGMSAATKTSYPVLTGSLLPIAQPSLGTGAAGSFSPTQAVTADFGNSLLFAAYDLPQTINNLSYTAPLTVSGATVTYSDGSPATVIVDLYRFYYYYLTTNNDHPIRGANAYRLVEWESGEYADYRQISGITDSALQGGIAKWLATPGKADPNIITYAITTAYDPTQTNPSNAFYALTTSSPYLAASPTGTPALTEAKVSFLTNINTGMLSSGFGYGISPNSSTWGDDPLTVPLYGLAVGTTFPSGFETGISGSGVGTVVLTRCALVAKGGAPRVVYNDSTIVTNVRNVWW